MKLSQSQILKPVAVAIQEVIGFRPPPATWRRWVRSGLKGRDGTRIKLRTLKVGGRLFSAEEHVREFVWATSNVSADVELARTTDANCYKEAMQFLDKELGIE
jgi:hypothetical protein